MVVGLGVHKHKPLAVVVEVLHFSSINVGNVNLDPGVEGLIDNFAVDHVFDFGPYECATFARLDVLEFDYHPQLPVHRKHGSIFYVITSCQLLASS